MQASLKVGIMMKKIVFMLVFLLFISGCSASSSVHTADASQKVTVVIRIIDDTDKYHYYGVSINKVHPDPGTLMINKINYIDKKTDIVRLEKGDQYRIDLAPFVHNPVEVMRNGSWNEEKVKQAKNAKTLGKHAEKKYPIRKIITPIKNNQRVTFVISAS
jgi:PBP1b-binding outer membrane lipoprotein LpoB